METIGNHMETPQWKPVDARPVGNGNHGNPSEGPHTRERTAARASRTKVVEGGCRGFQGYQSRSDGAPRVSIERPGRVANGCQGGLSLPAGPLAWVVVDIEASGLFPDDGARLSCVALAWPGPRGVETLGLPFDQGERDKLPLRAQGSLFGELEDDPNLTQAHWHGLLNWLSHQRLVFHNAKYDLLMLWTGTRDWAGLDLRDALYWDTMLAQKDLDPREPVGLDETAKRLGLGDGKVGRDEFRAWLKKRKHPKSRYDLVPWSLMEPYVCGDADLTAQLYQQQWRRLNSDPQGPERINRQIREMDLTRTLMSIEHRGMLYNTTRSLEIASRLDRHVATIAARLPFDPTPAGAKGYFFDTLKLSADRVSDKTGAPSLDDEQLRAFVQEEQPWAAEYSELNQAKLAVSRWYRGYAEKIGLDGRLRTSFKQATVKSGRMAVERVQLQAIPKENKNRAVGDIPSVRELLIAPEGKGLWSLDLSQAELRVAAKYANCQRMLKMLAEGADFHSITTQEVLGVSPDAPDWKLKRDIGKRLTFASIFQIGGETFQRQLAQKADIHLPLGECKRMVYGWRRLYPEMTWAYEKAERIATQRGWVRLLPNTDYEVQSWFGPRDWAHTAWSRIVQGSLAEAFKLLLIGVERQWPGYLILTVHDSIVLEMPLDEGASIAPAVASWAGELMTGLFGIQMKMDVDRWRT